jgi:transposase-like protein
VTSERKGVERLFEGRHFDREIIILCVRWYIRYKFSLRHLVRIMAERELSIFENSRQMGLSVPGGRLSWQGGGLHAQGIESRTNVMLGFKRLWSAVIMFSGVELAHFIRKEQFDFSALESRDVFAPIFWNADLFDKQGIPID